MTVRAIEAPETAASNDPKLAMAIEPMRRGEIKILLFIFVSPTQLFEQGTTELGLTSLSPITMY
jgi:hypothetical protein